jgi:hypothetical protein
LIVNALEKGETDKDKENARIEKRVINILNRKNEGVRAKKEKRKTTVNRIKHA